MSGKKKRHKDLASPLPRIGSSLLPNAVFVAVPSTAKQLGGTWPKRAESSHLACALGSVGNIAQVVAIGGNPRYDSSETESDDEEFDEIDDHYAVVNENDSKDSNSNDNLEGKVNEEVIYSKVNKKRNQQMLESESNSEQSDNDITDVSGTCSDFDNSLSSDNHNAAVSPKSHDKTRGSRKRRSSKHKTQRKNETKIVDEEPVVRQTVNEFESSAIDYCDGPASNNEESVKSDHNNNIVTTRDFHKPSKFEQEHFSKTDLEYDYNHQRTPPLSASSLTRGEVLGASALELTNIHESPPPDVPTVTNLRLAPVGKGESFESIEEQVFHKPGIEAQHRHSEDMEPLKKRKSREHRKKLKQVVEQVRTAQKEQYLTSSNEKPPEAAADNMIPRHHIHGHDTSGAHNTYPTATILQQTNIGDNITRRKSVQNNPPSTHSGSGNETSLVSKTVQNDEQMIEKSKDSKRAMKNKVKKRMKKQMADVVGEEVNRSMEGSRQKRQREKRKDKSSEETGGAFENDVNYETKQDTASQFQQISINMTKENRRHLRQQVKALSEENVVLENLSHSLTQENNSLKAVNQTLSRHNQPIADSSFLYYQNEELRSDNEFLKDSVYRLNMELGRYQAKYRPLLPQADDSMHQKSQNDKKSALLVNKKLLLPLLLAYDDRIREKQETIETYEKEIQNFKHRVSEIVRENSGLRERLKKSHSQSQHDQEDCMELEEQAKLVLQENAVLRERQDLQNKKAQEIQTFYKNEISRMSKLCASSDTEKDVLKSKLETVTGNVEDLKRELEEARTEWKKRVSLDEHLAIVGEFERKLRELKKQTEDEIDSLKLQLQATQKEKKSLAVQLADYKLANAQLEREIFKFDEVQRKNERKTFLLKEKLGHVQSRETNTQDTLSEVLKIAEKTSAERDILNEMLASQQSEQKKVQILVKNEEDKLKECKNRAYNKIMSIKGRVKEQERETERLREHYENELNTLRNLIRKQQRQLEDMVDDKRNLESELHNLSENIGEDNLLMRTA